ncbi:Beta-galactosidase 6 [Linum grandiflorum]
MENYNYFCLRRLSWLLAAVIAISTAVVVDGGNVTYDGRSLIIGGERKMLFSGSIHYPRSTPQMWGSLIAKAKEGGVDVIETYVFWNLHEPRPGQYDFGGRNDIVRFVKEVERQGLYVALRIGPFIEAEWTYGGLPFWLHGIPGIVYRTNNEPFKRLMQGFVTKIVNVMKSEGLFASQGGPIILAQIENEYQNVESKFKDGDSYVHWAANMAVELQTGVPWVMCKQTDAPGPVINTCNGMRCGDTFTGPNSPSKPALWTENWTSFLQRFGEEPYLRSAEDIAFHTLLFIVAKNGSFINYYMYHGGTNFGRSGAAYMLTGYYDQAPLDEYGLLREPKYSHLKEMHAAVKSCSSTLLNGVKTSFSLGRFQEAYVYEDSRSKSCAAFLVNSGSRNAKVEFRNAAFELLPKSISILPDCRTVVYNSAKTSSGFSNRRETISKILGRTASRWEEYREPIPSFLQTKIRFNQLEEHTQITSDSSDYLWYTMSFQSHSASCAAAKLRVKFLSHVVYVYVNGQFKGSATGNSGTQREAGLIEVPVSLGQAVNNISIVSAMVGLWDSGAFMEKRQAGLTDVQLQCSNVIHNVTGHPWGYKVGFEGESLEIYAQRNTDRVEWGPISRNADTSPKWYRTSFDAPLGDEPVALNLKSMGKGQAWVNGEGIGRYWVSIKTKNGDPSQTLYHVPREFLKPKDNLLVILEEATGDPFQITVVTISSTTKMEKQTSTNYSLS